MAAICPLVALCRSMRGKEKKRLSQALFYPLLIYLILPSNLTYWQLGLCFFSSCPISPSPPLVPSCTSAGGLPHRSLVLLKLIPC